MWFEGMGLEVKFLVCGRYVSCICVVNMLDF